MFTGTITRRTQKTSSDICLPDLPHTRPDHPQVRPTFFSASAVDRALGQLAGVHLRITVCHISLSAAWDIKPSVAEALRDPSLMISDLDDGSLLILYVGPRRSGAAGDLDAEQAIGRKLHRLSCEIPGTGDPDDMKVCMAHCWSDAMDPRQWAGDPLALVPTAPLAETNRAAA